MAVKEFYKDWRHHLRLLSREVNAGGGGGLVNTDINTATPPTTEAVTGEFSIFDLANDDQLAQFGFEGTNVLRIRNYFQDNTGTIDFFIAGETFPVARFDRTNPSIGRGLTLVNDGGSPTTQDTAFRHENSAGLIRGQWVMQSLVMSMTNFQTSGTMLFFTNGNAEGLRLNGSLVGSGPFVRLSSGPAASILNNLQTEGTGIVIGNSNSSASGTLKLRFQGNIVNVNGVTASIGFNSSSRLDITNDNTSGEIRIQGADSGNAIQLCANFNPNNSVVLYEAGVNVFQTATAANGGAESNNLATGSGFERVLTIADIGGGATAALGFYGAAPVAQAAAYTVTNPVVRRAFDTTTVTLAQLAEVVGTILADDIATGLRQ